MSQQQQAQAISVAPTATKTVVFPFKSGPKRFETNFYSPELTGGKVSLEEVNQFISRISSQFGRKYSVTWTKVGLYHLFGLLLPLLLSLRGVSYLAVHTDITLIEGNFLSLVFTEYFLLYMYWLFRHLSKGWLGPYSTSPLFEKCQVIVEEQNEILRSRGLKWNLPDHFPSHIELTEDLHKQANEFQVEIEENITFNLVKGRYSKDFYAPEMTEGRISHEEMCKFISKINFVLRKPLAKPDNKWWALFLCCDVWIFALIEIDKYYPSLLSFFMYGIIATILLLITIFIVIRVDSRDQKKFKNKFRARFQEPIREFNGALRSRGLRWHLPDQFPFSIELCKDYRNQNFNAQTVDLPPPGHQGPAASDKTLNEKFQNHLYAPLLEKENVKKSA